MSQFKATGVRGRPKKGEKNSERSLSMDSTVDKTGGGGGKRDREECSCIICEKVLEDWQFIECHVCTGQMCAECSGIDEAMIKSVYMSKLPGFNWTCQSCTMTLPTLTSMNAAVVESKEANIKVTKTLTDLKDANEARMTALETRIDGMEGRITKKLKSEFPGMIEKELKQVEEKLSEKVQDQMADMGEEIEKKVKAISDEIQAMQQNVVQAKDIEDRVRKEIQKELSSRAETTSTTGGSGPGPSKDGNPVSPRTHLRQTVASVTAELKSREGKRRNLVLYNLKEPNVNNDRAKRENADRDAMIDIASNALGIKNMKKEEMTRVTRLGTTIPEDRPRPLLIELTTDARKNQIFSNLTKLPGTDYNHLSFTSDMTKLEREQQRKLVVEAKRMEAEDGEKNRYRVRGPPWDMRVVRIEKKVRADTQMQTEEKKEEGEGRE